MSRPILYAALVVATAFVLGAVLLGRGGPDAADVRDLVRETIRENPEIVAEALEALQAEQAEAEAAAVAEILTENADRLAGGADPAVIGNPDGAVTVVEFFDYNCGYCRSALPVVADLIDRNPDVRVVARELPILSEGSVFAARAALAAHEQGRYAEVHDALMALDGPAEASTVLARLSEMDLDMDRLRADMGSAPVEAHLTTSMELARSLGINGTPTFVVGDRMLPGLVELDQLEAQVDRLRASDG